DQVRVGVLLAHQAQALEGDLAGGGAAAGALGGPGGGVAAAGAAPAAGAGAGASLLAAAGAASSVLAHAGSPCCGSVVKRASGASDAPRAQSAARIGRFPAGARAATAMTSVRSEERRVGKERRRLWSQGELQRGTWATEDTHVNAGCCKLT